MNLHLSEISPHAWFVERTVEEVGDTNVFFTVASIPHPPEGTNVHWRLHAGNTVPLDLTIWSVDGSPRDVTWFAGDEILRSSQPVQLPSPIAGSPLFDLSSWSGTPTRVDETGSVRSTFYQADLLLTFADPHRTQTVVDAGPVRFMFDERRDLIGLVLPAFDVVSMALLRHARVLDGEGRAQSPEFGEGVGSKISTIKVSTEFTYRVAH